MNRDQLTAQGYSIDTAAGKMDIPVIHAYLSNESYWSKNIPYHILSG